MEATDLYAAVAPLPARFNLADYFLDHNLAAGRGDKQALFVGQDSRSYAQLAEGSRRVAGCLRQAGVRPEERVLMLLPDDFEFAEVFFGILRMGGVFAMVNPLLKQADFAYYLEYSKARVVFAHASTLAELQPALEASRWCEKVVVVGADELPAGDRWVAYDAALAAIDPEGPLGALESTGPDDLAGWLFTSGSTGEPKACVHSHSDFAYSTETYALQVAQFCESDKCMGVPKLFFGYATGTNLMFPFRAGASAVLFSARSTADELFDQIAAHRPTLLVGVPTMINNMLRSPRIDAADLSSLRIMLSAGEALPPQLYSEWHERTGVEILDGIGSAEMFHIYISNRIGDVKLGSLGKVVPGYEASVVSPSGEPVPSGEPGRLRVRGGSTALCYWGDKLKSRESFQGEWCTSGDVFRCDAEGYFFYEGRADDLIKVSGIWTSPLEIENTLLSHKAVQEVCVLGHADAQQLTKPFAFVVLCPESEGCEALAEELKQWVKEHLAPHKYPRWFEWCTALPKNDRGKIARKDLKGRLDSGDYSA